DVVAAVHEVLAVDDELRTLALAVHADDDRLVRGSAGLGPGAQAALERVARLEQDPVGHAVADQRQRLLVALDRLAGRAVVRVAAGRAADVDQPRILGRAVVAPARRGRRVGVRVRVRFGYLADHLQLVLRL